MGGLASPPFMGMTEARYLVIDGGCFEAVLREISERYYGGIEMPVNYTLLISDHKKAFYYDAIPVQKTEETRDAYDERTASKRELLNKISRQDAFHVRTGDAHHRKRRGNEQKMVDVQLAVDTIAAASRGVFTKVSLVTSDLDFKPLINNLVTMGIDVTLLHRKGHTNDELIAAADRALVCDADWVNQILDYDFRLSQPMPSRFMQHADQYADAPIRLRWNDPKYGECLVKHAGFDYLVLTPIDLKTNMCKGVICDNKQRLRTYCNDMLEMEMPDF